MYVAIAITLFTGAEYFIKALAAPKVSAEAATR